MQNQNSLRAEFAANPSAADADEKSVDGHEPFDEEVFHASPKAAGLESKL
jgi:hypothetical protein